MYICKLFLYISYLGQIVHVYKQDLHLVPTMVRKLLSTGYQQYVWERMCPSHLLSEFIPFSSHCVLSAKMVVSSFHTFFCKQNIGNRNKRRTGITFHPSPLPINWVFHGVFLYMYIYRILSEMRDGLVHLFSKCEQNISTPYLKFWRLLTKQ